MDKKDRLMRSIVTSILVLLATALAILSKAMLPNEVNINDFNSIFVKTLGFPIVASMYFLIIYLHNAIVTQLFAKRSKLSKNDVGIRFGSCFALIYFAGMQEVVVEASPFSSWGINFVIYQFFMGIGEAVIALILCILIANFTVKDKKQGVKINYKFSFNKLIMVFFIAMAFIVERIVCYRLRIIDSDIFSFPIPTCIWTVLFGIILGICYVTLQPVFIEEKNIIKINCRIVVLTIGLSWIIFNGFIGLIIEGTIQDILTRSILDVISVFLGVLLCNKYLNTNKIKSYNKIILSTEMTNLNEGEYKK